MKKQKTEMFKCGQDDKDRLMLNEWNENDEHNFLYKKGQQMKS